MIANIATTLFASEKTTEIVLGKLTEILCKGKDEITQLLGDSLLSYLGNTAQAFSETKTFLFRDSKVPFYKTYFPLSLKNSSRREFQVTESVDDFFGKHNCITIIGTAGSGKSMLTRHLYLSCIKTSNHIPLYIGLRRLSTEVNSLTDYINKVIFNYEIAQNKDIYNRMLKSGSFVFLFDGYDEVSMTNIQNINNQIEDFVALYPSNHYVITSRPGARAENLTRFENYKVCPLSEEEIMQFIDIQCSLLDDGEELALKLKNSINKGNGMGYQEYLKSPLLLSMLIYTFKNYPEIPKSKEEFYFNVFETLFQRHDTISKSGVFTHDKITGLEKSQLLQILEWFCYITYFRTEYSFTSNILQERLTKVCEKLKIEVNIDNLIYDLETSISILVKDGEEYKFPHRSMQEYFCASLIRSLPEINKLEKIYHKQMPRLDSNESRNFWSLLEEMDEYSFKRDFICFQLAEFISLVKKDAGNNPKDEVDIMENFFSLMNFELFLTVDDEDSSKVRLSGYHLSYKRKGSFYFELLMYISLVPFIIFDNLTDQGGIIPAAFLDTVECIDEKKPLYRIKHSTAEEIQKCIDSGLVKSVNDYVNKIVEISQKIYNDTTDAMERQLSLLDL